MPYVPAVMLRLTSALLVVPALLAPVQALPSVTSAARAAAAQDDLPDLKGVLDGTCRWLRSTQNPAEGSYGGGVEGTAWVLYALAKSPRAYESADNLELAREENACSMRVWERVSRRYGFS